MIIMHSCWNMLISIDGNMKMVFPGVNPWWPDDVFMPRIVNCKQNTWNYETQRRKSLNRRILSKKYSFTWKWLYSRVNPWYFFHLWSFLHLIFVVCSLSDNFSKRKWKYIWFCNPSLCKNPPILKHRQKTCSSKLIFGNIGDFDYLGPKEHKKIWGNSPPPRVDQIPPRPMDY